MAITDFFVDPFDFKFKKLDNFIHERLENLNIEMKVHSGDESIHGRDGRYEDLSERGCYYQGIIDSFFYASTKLSWKVSLGQNLSHNVKWRIATAEEKEKRLLEMLKDTYGDGDIADVITIIGIHWGNLKGGYYYSCPRMAQIQKDNYTKGLKVGLEIVIKKLREIYNIV